MAKYIAVKTTEGDVKIRVIAHKGQWALHNKLKHEGCEPELFSTIKNIFTITHIPTGLSVVSKLEGKKYALLCFEILAEKFSDFEYEKDQYILFEYLKANFDKSEIFR